MIINSMKILKWQKMFGSDKEMSPVKNRKWMPLQHLVWFVSYNVDDIHISDRNNKL